MEIAKNELNGTAENAATPGLDLPGFDVAGALQRLAGNQKLYRTLLERFYQSYGKFGAEMQSLLAEGKLEDAQRGAHTIKGLAGTIGHAGLAEAALSLEMACKNSAPAPDLAAAQAAFAAQLDAVLKALDGIFSQS